VAAAPTRDTGEGEGAAKPPPEAGGRRDASTVAFTGEGRGTAGQGGRFRFGTSVLLVMNNLRRMVPYIVLKKRKEGPSFSASREKERRTWLTSSPSNPRIVVASILSLRSRRLLNRSLGGLDPLGVVPRCSLPPSAAKLPPESATCRRQDGERPLRRKFGASGDPGL
jgi:hypothetical protein